MVQNSTKWVTKEGLQMDQITALPGEQVAETAERPVTIQRGPITRRNRLDL